MAQERGENASNIGNLYAKVELDTDDAVKALKALQRHARETTQVLREVESVGNARDIDNDTYVSEYIRSAYWTNPKFLAQFTTQQLADELGRREGVSCYDVTSEEKAYIDFVTDKSYMPIDEPAQVIVINEDDRS